MAIICKTVEQIERMRAAGRVVRRVLDRLGAMIAPGVTTEELNAEAERLCRDYAATPLFKGVPGRGRAGPFPGAICSSINEQVVHGIPSSNVEVCEGDIVSIDFGVKLDGYLRRGTGAAAGAASGGRDPQRAGCGDGNDPPGT